MANEQYALPRPDDEPGFKLHPWIPGNSPAESRRELEAACRLAWLIREFHSRSFGFLREAGPSPDSPRAVDELLANDPDASEALRRSIDVFSAAASDHLASVAHMIWAGAYLFSLPVVIRASVENSIAACWSLNPELQPERRAERAHVLRYNDVSRFIEESPTKEISRDAKTKRRKYKKDLQDRFEDRGIAFDGNGRLTRLGETAAPTFDSQFMETSRRLGLDDGLVNHYGMLSQMAHPNPASFEYFYQGDGVYRREPSDTKQLIWVAVFSYAQLVRHVTGYFAAPASVLEEFELAVKIAFPDFYSV